MKFLSVKANNFMSFKELDFIFPEVGLYFVGGKVEDGSMSSSNGAGKSALFEALCYGLFGRTIRNAGKDDIINRESGKDCSVEVIVEDDEGIYSVIQRYRKDSKRQNDLLLHKTEENITASDVHKTQEMIDSILGMNWLVFNSAVVFGEKAKRFIEAGDAEKKEIFDEIVMSHLDFISAHKQVKGDYQYLLEKNGTMEFGIGAAKTGLEEVRVELEVTDNSLEELQKEKENVQEQIEQRTKKVIDIDEQSKSVKSAYGEAKDDLETLEEQGEKIYEYTKKLKEDERKELAVLEETNRKTQDMAWPVTYRIDEILSWLEKKDDLPKGTRCETCGIEITEESVDNCAKHYEEEYKGLLPKKKKLDLAQQEASKKEREAAKEWEKKSLEAEKTKSGIDKQLDVQKDFIRKAEGDISAFENDVALIKKEIEHLDSDLKDREATLLQTKERLEERLFSYKNKIKTIEKEMAESEEEAKYLKFWIEGFSGKGIKSLLLDEILPQLNNRADYYGSVLLDNEIRMEFDTEATLKSGDIRDKFNIKLFVGSDGEQVDYKSCSSGEKGRIDAAVLLALQGLIFERSACASSLVIFDEVFEHLDSIGIERMVNLLSEEAKNKAIFVISHQNEFADYFDNLLMVKKENGESRLVSE